MPVEAGLENCDCIAYAPRRVKTDGVDVSISRAARIKFGGPAKLNEGIIGPFQAIQRQAQSVVQPGILRRIGYRRAKGAFSIAITVQLPIQIRKVDGRHRVLWT